MLRKIVILMMAWVLGVCSPSLLYAGEAVSDATQDAICSSKNAECSSKKAERSTQDAVRNYIIGPGDVLDISVWKDEALTRSCIVRPDGVISFPLIGEVQAAGRTSSQLKTELEQKLTRYVPKVILSLEVKQVNSLIIYVIGKVNTPGRFVLNADIDVLQALATAGGLNVFAKGGWIKIFRQDNNKTTIYPFDYDDVVQGKHLEQNIYLSRGDVVVVP
ncbi:MAG TPA: polysaccharide biosynthesis/export family protein [Dissulfurispiraceae bacterium]|nr:polysaccharide biosynthesis/export family protein [Dissulfurispiraceae bacterium]